MKFMHLSDVHLGVEPDAGKAWSKKRAQDIWDSFAETVLEAGRQQVQFLLISGDLFHKQPLKRELREVNYLFEQIPQVKVVLMAGNHDYIQPKSYYVDFSWAENVYFFEREEVTAFDFPEENVTIYGLSYWHREIAERLYDRLNVAEDGRIHVLLAHGGDERHIPFSVKQILEQGIDYIAAGHIHKGGWLVEERAAMAGALEPTDCNDTGEHGYWLGELIKSKQNLSGVVSKVHFFPIRKCEYHHLHLTVTPNTTQYALEAMVRKVLAEGEAYKYYRIFLEGYMEPDMEYDLNRIEQLEHVVDVMADLQPDYHYDSIVEEQPESLLARYIVRMQKFPQNEITKKALEYGVNALLGHKICK